MKHLVLIHDTVTHFDNLNGGTPFHKSFDEDDEMLVRFARQLGFDFLAQEKDTHDNRPPPPPLSIPLNRSTSPTSSISKSSTNSLCRSICEYIISHNGKQKRRQILASHRSKRMFCLVVLDQQQQHAELLVKEELINDHMGSPSYLNCEQDVMTAMINENTQGGFRTILYAKKSLNAAETTAVIKKITQLRFNVIREDNAVTDLFKQLLDIPKSFELLTILSVREDARVMIAACRLLLLTISPPA